MKALGFVNRFGRGVLRAQEALQDNGNGPAEFQFDANYVLALIQEAIAALARICNDIHDPAVLNRVADVAHSSIRRLKQILNLERVRNRPAA